MENLELVLGTSECSIQRVVSIIVEDAKLIENWTSVARALDIPTAEIMKLQQDLLLNKINYFDLFLLVVEKWVGMKGKDAKLVMLILVMEEEGKAVNVLVSIKLHFKLPTYDSISWEILPQALQVKAINNLHKLVPNLSIEDIKPYLKGTALVQLIKGIPQTLPESLSYYVHRTVLTRNLISSNIFDNCPPHIFLISGIAKYDLSKLAKNKTTSNSTRQILQRKITVKHIKLDSPHHFDKICELTRDPVHWLSFEGNKLKWIQSRGGISAVQGFVDKSQDILHETDFVNSFPPNSNNPICISDSPGMGKSVFLAEIGRKLVDLYPDRAVIFLVLGEFIKTIKRIDDKGLVHPFMNGPNKNGVSMELLLDGFDEVDSSERKFAHELLRSMRTSCKSVRMWVTSRPHLMEELERTLDTIGFNIQPFSVDDQQRFLTSYWLDKNPNIKNQDKLTTFANHSLTTLKSTMKSKESDIAGIPLQCLLIGEVYEEEALAFANSEQSTSPTILITSITELYESLIHRKFQKGGLAENETKMMYMHARLALELIFPGEFEKLKYRFGPIEIEDILKIGICQVSNDSTVPRFLHRTFAEYFVAWWVGERVWNWIVDANFVGFFMTRVLKCDNMNFTHHVITYFLNSLLEKHPGNPISSDSINETIDQPQNVFTNFLINMYPDSYKNIALACVITYRLHIFKWLMKLGPFDARKHEIFHNDLLLKSMIYSSLEFVKIVLEQFEEHHIFDVDVQGKCLRIAVKYGRFSIVEFLIKERQLHGIVEELDGDTRKLLHDCVIFSYDNSPLQIDDRIQIIRMLTDINPALVDMKDEDNHTPLVTSLVHIRLRIELIRLGANVLNVNKDSNTVLHLDYGSNDTLSMSADYHLLILSIPEEALRILVRRMETEYQRTPLLSILYYFNPLPATLDVFKRLGADFNHVDEKGYVPLRRALQWERNGATIRKLIECGADVYWKENKTGWTLLHTAMTKYSRVLPESIAVLLKWIDADVKDLSGKTAIDCAMENGANFSLELVKIVLEQFEEHHIFDVDVQGKCLRIAVGYGWFSTVEFLIKERQLHGIVEGLNGDTRELLHDCVGGSQCHSPLQIDDRIQIIRMFTDINPALVDMKDQYNNTPLVTQDVHIRLRIELIRAGANVLNVGEYSYTVLHLDVGFNDTLSMNTDYHSLILSIPEDALRILVRRKETIFQQTPLLSILKYFDPLPATLDVFKRLGADFNHVDKDGYVPLRTALQRGRNGATIRKLIECGADVHRKIGWRRRTLLHYAAKDKYGLVLPESIAVLLEWIDADVKDFWRKTSMDYAMKEGAYCVQNFKEGLALAGKSS